MKSLKEEAMEEVPGGGVAASEVHVFKRVSKFIDYGGPKFRFPGLWTTIFMFWWSCVAFSSASWPDFNTFLYVCYKETGLRRVRCGNL